MAEVETNPVVLPDDQYDGDQDSTLGSDAGSSTQSISSTILDYRRENGRTYHGYKDGNLQHHLCLLTYGDRLGIAPPGLPDSKVKNVLDVGTGTGIWAIDFGDEHPEAQVVGIDLSPTQPSVNLTPGGWVEIQEVGCEMASDDNTVTKDTALYKWCKLLDEAAVKLGRPFVKFDEMREHMIKAGFTDVVDKRFKWPTNRWPKERKYKELGAWNNENTGAALEALTLAPFTRGLGWSHEEVVVFLTDVRKELNDPRIHAYWPICSIYGKKPEAT
ncbi:hypothetical protein G7Z17_g4390 [Cylindrodendrum hubeiense]|uniref:Methyltransferase n=1 Tax=Cylindrodendrum hubeiense TaxID=595255 RepID=A0A9P5HH03_9HYPO|nr:hypothetical protein G7Z17_g4390 [Cylindrodendrum hubeiense]